MLIIARLFRAIIPIHDRIFYLQVQQTGSRDYFVVNSTTTYTVTCSCHQRLFIKFIMAERTVLDPISNSDHTKATRSNSYNPPSSQLLHLTARSRRTFSLPCREKPSIPPVLVQRNTSSINSVCGAAQMARIKLQNKTGNNEFGKYIFNKWQKLVVISSFHFKALHFR